MPQFQGVPQYATTGWASPPQQQPPQQQPAPAPPTPPQTGPSESTSDNIFYAIVALLPELSPKHLLWVKGEVRCTTVLLCAFRPIQTGHHKQHCSRTSARHAPVMHEEQPRRC